MTGPDGAGLSNVSVQVYRSTQTGWQPMQWTATDLNGDYDARGLRAGTYRIGFSTHQGGFTPEFWDNASSLEKATDVLVDESATVTNKNAQLSIGARIAGTVTGPDGATLPNIPVHAYRYSTDTNYWTQVGMTSTGSDGTYTLGGLTPGTYRVGFATYPGEYVGEYWDDASSVGAAKDIVLQESELVGGTDAKLARASRIAGTVTGSQGGLAGVYVQAYQRTSGQSYWTSVSSAQTNSDGTYSLGGLKAGTYRRRVLPDVRWRSRLGVLGRCCDARHRDRHRGR